MPKKPFIHLESDNFDFAAEITPLVAAKIYVLLMEQQDREEREADRTKE